VLGFMAPLVVVRRKADGVRGSLEFQHNPRFLFQFSARVSRAQSGGRTALHGSPGRFSNFGFPSEVDANRRANGPFCGDTDHWLVRKLNDQRRNTVMFAAHRKALKGRLVFPGTARSDHTWVAHGVFAPWRPSSASNPTSLESHARTPRPFLGRQRLHLRQFSDQRAATVSIVA